MVTHLEYSRSYPVPAPDAFDRVLPAPLSQVLGRRYLLVAGVKSADQLGPAGAWGAAGAGQQRRIRFSDGGTALETLTGIEAPHWFGYHLDSFTGLLKPLIRSVEGRWSFATDGSDGSGARVTWTWDVTPANAAAGVAMPVVARLWAGFARQGFDDIGKLLVGRPG